MAGIEIRQRLVLPSILLLIAAAAIVDEVFSPRSLLPAALYAVPALVAAYLVSPGQVVWTAAGSMLTYLTVASAHGSLTESTMVHTVTLVLTSYLAVALSRRIGREAELKLRAEVLARESRDTATMLSTLIETLPAGVIVYDDEGQVMIEKTAARSLDGRLRQAHGIGDAVVSSSGEKRGAIFSDIPGPWLDGKSDLVVPNREGGETALLVADSEVTSATGQRIGKVRLFQDITERKRIESQLLFQSRALSQVNDAVVFADMERVVTYWNEAAERLYGVPAREAVGKKLDDLRELVWFSDKDRDDAAASIGASGSWCGETCLRLPSGKDVAVEASVRILVDEEGTAAGFLSILRDARDRRAAEAERDALLAQLRRQAVQMETTISSMAEAILIYDSHGGVEHMNPALQRMLGYDVERARLSLGERMAMLRMENASGRLAQVEQLPVTRALRGETVRGEIMAMHPSPDRVVWASISAAPLLSPEGTVSGAVALFTDITGLRGLQEEQEEYLKIVSHDLRSPLSVAFAHASTLQRGLHDGSDAPMMDWHADTILTSLRRMDGMIQDLVECARLESGRLEPQVQSLDLVEFVVELISRMARVGWHGRVLVEAREESLMVEADPGRLERVLTNLVSNALKYSEPDTEVRVTLDRQGDEAVVSVVDRGYGISEPDLQNLFQKFYRTTDARKRRQGIGLGLYITRRFVESLGGRIWVESKVGEGSTFSFALPLR